MYINTVFPGIIWKEIYVQWKLYIHLRPRKYMPMENIYTSPLPRTLTQYPRQVGGHRILAIHCTSRSFSSGRTLLPILTARCSFGSEKCHNSTFNMKQK